MATRDVAPEAAVQAAEGSAGTRGIRAVDCALKQQLSLASQILYMEGHNDVNHGQISGRVGGDTRFFLRGAAIGFEEVGPDDFVELEGDGRVIAGSCHRPSEWPIHTEIYAARPDVNAVVHTHPPSATAFGALGQQLLPLSHDGCPFYRRLNRFDLTTNTVLTVDVARDMVSTLGRNPAVLLKNHGVVVVGRSVRAATVLAVMLERACALQLKVAALSPSGSPESDVSEKNEFIFSDIAMRTYWDYFLRKLHRVQKGTQLQEQRA
jgi:L-fuculose-phosphate aldolase